MEKVLPTDKYLPTAKYWFAPEGFVIRVVGEPVGRRRRHKIRLMTDGRCIFESHSALDFAIIDSLNVLGNDNRCKCIDIRKAFRAGAQQARGRPELSRGIWFESDLGTNFYNEIVILHHWWDFVQLFRRENRLLRKFFRKHSRAVRDLYRKVESAPTDAATEALQEGLPGLLTLAIPNADGQFSYDSCIRFLAGCIALIRGDASLTISDQEIRNPKVFRAVLEHVLRWYFGRIFQKCELDRDLRVAEEMACIPKDVLQAAEEIEKSAGVCLRTDRCLPSYRRVSERLYVLCLETERWQDFEAAAVLRMWQSLHKYLSNRQARRKEGKA